MPLFHISDSDTEWIATQPGSHKGTISDLVKKLRTIDVSEQDQNSFDYLLREAKRSSNLVIDITAHPLRHFGEDPSQVRGQARFWFRGLTIKMGDLIRTRSEPHYRDNEQAPGSFIQSVMDEFGDRLRELQVRESTPGAFAPQARSSALVRNTALVGTESVADLENRYPRLVKFIRKGGYSNWEDVLRLLQRRRALATAERMVESFEQYTLNSGAYKRGKEEVEIFMQNL
ncbi:hypothetical protein T439DRAFT_352310 [Meredithblackwellia eburnea MCA 4105]